MENQIVFKSQQGNPVTTSKLIAQKFERQHKNVLQTIDDIIKDMQVLDNEHELTSQPMFQPTSSQYFYEYLEDIQIGNGATRKERCFMVSRKGFELVVMHFKGQRALQFKLEFIEAFDAMQKEIERLKTQQNTFQVPTSFREALLLAAKQQEVIEQQQAKIAIDKPKVDFYDSVLHSDSTFTTTQIAKELGMSAAALNKRLHEMKIQYKQNGSWVPYAKFHAMELTKSETVIIEKNDGKKIAILSFKWTEKGREFVHSKIKMMEAKNHGAN